MALMHVQDRMSGNNCERGSLTLKTQLERESFLRLSAPLLGAEEPRESEKASVPAAALRAVYGHYVALGWLNGIAISTAFAYCYYEERASANTCTARPGVVVRRRGDGAARRFGPRPGARCANAFWSTAWGKDLTRRLLRRLGKTAQLE